MTENPITDFATINCKSIVSRPLGDRDFKDHKVEHRERHNTIMARQPTELTDDQILTATHVGRELSGLSLKLAEVFRLVREVGQAREQIVSAAVNGQDYESALANAQAVKLRAEALVKLVT